jgi:F-type H+-transporting ATPase subunit gamma
LHQGKTTNNVGLLVISSDRGLCGSFNTLLLKETLSWIKSSENKKIFTFIVGRKALNFLGRLKKFNIEVSGQMTGIFPKVSYANARIISENITKTFKEKKLDNLTIIYNEFTSMLTQTVKVYRFLPLAEFEVENKETEYNFMFEPSKEKILRELVPRYINASTYKILLESQAAELAARMNAMDNASKNARDLIDDLTVKLNRIRQESITTEIAEIVGGMEALKG